MYSILIGEPRERALAQLDVLVAEQEAKVAETTPVQFQERAKAQLSGAVTRARALIKGAGELDLISVNLQGNLDITAGQVVETDHFFVGITPVA